MTLTPADGGTPITLDVAEFKGAGVMMGMHNTNASIEGFARASLNYGLSRGFRVYLQPQEHDPQGL